MLRQPGAVEDVLVRTSLTAMDAFGLWALPSNGYGNAGRPRPDVEHSAFRMGRIKWWSLQICLPSLPGSRAARYVRFGLSKSATKRTVQLIAEHLDRRGEPWLYIEARKPALFTGVIASTRWPEPVGTGWKYHGPGV